MNSISRTKYDKIIDLASIGLSSRLIALVVGVSKNTVKKVAKEAGVWNPICIGGYWYHTEVICNTPIKVW